METKYFDEFKHLNKEITEAFLFILNDAYKLDNAAIHSLVCNRVPCNKNLADHPTIVVDSNTVTDTDTYAVGMLGIINGVLAHLTGKHIAGLHCRHRR